MSGANLFLTRKKGFDLRTKTITASTYIVKVGTVANDFVIERVLNANQSPCVVTLPDGTYVGQRVRINVLDSTIIGTVQVAASTGTGGDSTMSTTGMHMSLEWVNSTVGWVVLSEYVTT